MAFVNGLPRAHANALKLSDADRFVLEEFWLTFEHRKQRLEAAEKQRREFAQSDPPLDKKARESLQSLPGVGRITIDVFLAETSSARTATASLDKRRFIDGLSPPRRGVRMAESGLPGTPPSVG